MNITIEQKKQKALELMKKLDIYKPYIKALKKTTRFAFLKALADFGHIKSLNLWKK